MSDRLTEEDLLAAKIIEIDWFKTPKIAKDELGAEYRTLLPPF